MTLPPEQLQRLRVARDADVIAARQASKQFAQGLGFSRIDVTLIATAVSEVARNIISHAGDGFVEFSRVSRGVRVGLQVLAKDDGPGIADVQLAMQDGYSTGNSLGLGLPGARRVMDEMSVESTEGNGTSVTLIKWLPPSRRARR